MKSQNIKIKRIKDVKEKKTDYLIRNNDRQFISNNRNEMK